MRRAIAHAALGGLLAAIAACTPRLEIPAGARVSCTDNGQCPAGRICHSGFCVDAGSVDTVPPDLAAPPVVTPAIGKAGASFVVAVTSTKNLLQPPSLVLGLDVPVEVTCVLASGRNYTCPYTATGNENGGAGGLASFDVRLLDTSYNEVVKRLAGVLRLDFRPPDVLSGSASLVLIPPAANPLRTLGAAGPGATMHVAFTVDEALASDPAVTGAGTGTRLVFTKLGEAGESFIYQYVLTDPSPGQGTYAVEVTLTDLAGNVATRTLSLQGAGLVVDTVAPTTPATGTAGAVVYDRVPWGSQATSGSPRFDVSGAMGAVEGNAVVQVFDGPDPATAAELGRGAAAADGSFAPISVGRADHVVVYVAAVDAAGNRSPRSDVKDVRWTATLGGKVPGSTIENPTSLVSTPWLAPVAAQDPGIAAEPDQASLDAVKLQDSSSLTRVAEQRWLQRNTAAAAPLRRYKHTMAYDSDGGKMLVFGGFATDTGRDQNDLWEWDGAIGVWKDRTPIGLRPGPSQAAVMVYDQRRARMLMFVGEDDVTGGTATWEWDPATGFWFDRSPPGGSPSPPGRTFFAMAYDSGRGTAVLFGGTSAVTPFGDLNDIWEWDGAAGTWTQRLPNGDPNSPGARHDMAMAYDSARGKVVLWGGYGGSGPDDTWEWDGSAGSWTHLLGVNGPASDGGARMAYDAARQKLVLWGGGNWTTSSTLWEYDPAGPGWRNQTPAGTLPCGVEDVGLAYDVARGRTVLFGGVGNCPGNSYTNEVWDWTGNPVASPGTWTNWTLLPSSVPIGRKAHAVAYDPVRRKVVLYGGATDGGVVGGTWTPLSDTWEMDPDTGNWTLRTPASNPGARVNMAMAFDPARKTIILFGGTKATFDAETWEWNGVAGTWTRLTPATSPSARAYHRMVSYVRGGGSKILMFGGAGGSVFVGYDTTWEWDGVAGTWFDKTTGSGSPNTRGYPGLAWDSDRQLVIMYGGYDYLSAGAPYNRNDLWEWDGKAWTTHTTANPPPLRADSFGFVHDLARRKLVLWGGQDSTNYNAMRDIWEWDATSTTWTNRTPSSGSFPARYSLAAWYDPVRRAPAMFGGGGNFWEAFKQGTWEWQPGDLARPALVWTVAWSASGEKNARFLAIDVSASASGQGSSSAYPAAAVLGASILGWDHLGGAWRTLASNAAGGAPAPMTYVTADPVGLARVLPGTALSTTIAVAPVGFNQQGTALSQVKLDYLELVVTYRRAP